VSEPDTGGGAVALATGAAAPSISVHGLTKRYGEVEAVRGMVCLAVAIVEFSGRDQVPRGAV